MYLQDFQKIGGIFKPGKVLSSSPKKVHMCGELYLQGETFYVKVTVQKNQYTKITKVCGHTLGDAVFSKKKLKHIYLEALKNNQFDLRTFVRARHLRLLMWFFITLSNFSCVVLSVYNIFQRGGTLPLVIALIVSVFLFFVCITRKMAMIRVS